MIIHSVVGFKAKRFNLVHQIVFLVRGVVWVQDYNTSLAELVDAVQSLLMCPRGERGLQASF